MIGRQFIHGYRESVRRRRCEDARKVIMFLKQNPKSDCDQIWQGTQVGAQCYPNWCIDRTRRKSDKRMVYSFNALKFERRMANT